MSQTVQVDLGPLLFEFRSYQHWVNKARSWFSSCGESGRNTLCLDAKNRICLIGKHFMQARDENAFPVRVYCMFDPLGD